MHRVQFLAFLHASYEFFNIHNGNDSGTTAYKNISTYRNTFKQTTIFGTAIRFPTVEKLEGTLQVFKKNKHIDVNL